MSTTAETFVQALADQGVRHVFGIPGGPWIPYMEAMRKRDMAFVLTANEAGAAFMADVCARLTGTPGVCHGTFGPGATNLATGVCSAYLDRSPVIAVTTEQSAPMRPRTTQMNIDHQALFAPITKWTTRLSSGSVTETVRQAFATALSEVPGPVHIGHPVDLSDRPAPGPASTEKIAGLPALRPTGDELEAVARIIDAARKPLIAVGLTAARFRLGAGIRQLAERLQAPVVLTPMAKGLLPEDHKWYAGVLFHAQSERLSRIIRQADLVIGLGYDPVEFNYEPWFPETPLIHVDTTPPDIEAGIELALACTGDLRTALAYLADRSERPSDWNPEVLAEHRLDLFDSLRRSESDFGPAAALDILRELLPDDAIMACDVGAHTHLIGQIWRTPGQGLQLMTNGGSSMGFGVPAAIAAALCQPGQPVACVTGDGGFLMMAGELVTARRYGLPVVFVVLADRSISLIEVKQGWRQVDGSSSVLYDGAFLDADRLFGVPVLSADRPESFRRAIRQALSQGGPVVVEAVVDGRDYHHLISRSYR